MAKQKRTYIDWHSGFKGAIPMEFKEDRDYLTFDYEKELTKRPLALDCLIIKKNSHHEMHNEIGKIFRTYNILEYKRPTATLDEDVLAKLNVYAGLLKIQERTKDPIPFEEITISVIRNAYPRKLLDDFARRGIKITNPYPGIYYIESFFPYKTQIIVGRQLKGKEHRYLKALTGNADSSMFDAFLRDLSNKNNDYQDDINIKAIATVMARANRDVFNKWLKEVKGMDFLEEVAYMALGDKLEEKDRMIEGQNRQIEDLTSEINDLKLQIEELLQEVDSLKVKNTDI